MSTIKSLRMQSGYTQRELANKCSMNIRHIQKLESGEVDVGSLKAKSFMMLAQTLDISPNDLIQLSQSESIDFVDPLVLENTAGDVFTLDIPDYEFPDKRKSDPEGCDSHWLNVSCYCVIHGITIQGTAPCLETYDVLSLADRLAKFAAGEIDFVRVEPLENNFRFSLKRINGNAILSTRFCPENTCRRKMTLREYQEFAANLPDFVMDVDEDTLNRITQFIQNAILRLRMK